MSFKICQISGSEIHADDHRVIKDFNDNWVATPVIENPSLEKAVFNFIKALP